MRHETEKKSCGKSVVVVGAGGNIGSHLVPHLGRMHGVGRVTLIDRDAYEPSNLRTQAITPGDVGRRKAAVQARRLLRINPALRVAAIKGAVENVPLGLLRADVIVACLDSRRARQYVNQAAWRLGVMWIDAGVEADDLLARVNVYAPGVDNPCLECAWDERDYAALEQTYPCSGPVEQTYPTNAPSSLGALAASLQAIECEKILTGQMGLAAVGRQVLIGAAHHKHFVTAYRRNPECRLYGHETWKIERLRLRPEELTLDGALKLAGRVGADGGPKSLRVEGTAFVRELTCPGCGRSRRLLRLRSRLGAAERKCAGCGRTMEAAGRGLLERLDAASLPAGLPARSLRSLGLVRGDVFGVGTKDAESHFEIGVDRV